MNYLSLFLTNFYLLFVHFDVLWPGNIIGLCASGFSCLSGSPSPTPEVTLRGPNTNAGPCPPGHFCPYGSVTPLACPEATFKSNYGGVGNISDCLPCPSGQKCLEGTFYQVFF